MQIDVMQIDLMQINAMLINAIRCKLMRFDAIWFDANWCKLLHFLIRVFSFTVVPQPVYMNMNDLKALAAQKAAVAQQGFPDFAEDSPELKTPTAEDMMVPEQKVLSTFVFNET